MDTFMFEGHDTTTSGTCWTLYILAKYISQVEGEGEGEECSDGEIAVEI